MKYIEFKPKYNLLKSLISYAIFIFLLENLITDWNMYLDSENKFTLVLNISLCIFLLIIEIVKPRKILISNTDLILNRFLLSKKIYSLSELTDISKNSIRFGKGQISLYGIKNSSKLISILFQVLEKEDIQPSNFEGKLAYQEMSLKKINAKAFLVTLSIYAVVFFIIYYFIPTMNLIEYGIILLSMLVLGEIVHHYFYQKDINPNHVKSEFEYFRKKSHTNEVD